MRLRQVILSALIPATALISAAQDNISPAGRLEIMKYEQSMPASRAGNAPSVLATIKLSGNSAQTISSIEDKGATVLRRFGNFAIVSMPIDIARQVAVIPGVKSMSFGEKARPMLVKARSKAEVDAVQKGLITTDSTDPIPALKGKGVVTGIYDSGFDVRHINFNDAEGKSRIRQFTLMSKDGSGEIVADVLDTPDEIYRLETDNNKSNHGTHVAGIMTGSYNGRGEAVQVGDGDMVRVLSSKVVPFFGVATESDIVMGAGLMDLNAMLVGVSDVIEYAQNNGKPAVVNLSLGLNIGPHDGSTVFSQALAELGKDAVIVVAAGNEGDLDIALRGTITAESPTLKSFFSFPTKDTTQGQMWFMAPDASQVKGSIVIYDTSTNKEMARVDLSNDRYQGFGSNPSISGLTNHEAFSANFTGSVYGFYGYDEQTGKGMVLLECRGIKARAENSYRIGIELSAPDGTPLYGYSYDEVPFTSMSLPGWTAGTPNGSISDMACGENIISVGSFCSARNFAQLGDKKGYRYYPSNIVGAISSFSSYGELMNGSTRPHVAAPGSVLISSYSTPYFIAEGLKADEMQAKAEGENSRMNYWSVMQGTSQATPMVSGIVAMMLEADPTLDFAEVLSIIDKTSAEDDYTSMEPIRWGAGKIDATAAIKEVYARKSTGIEGIVTDGLSDIIVTTDGTGFSIFAPGAAGIEAVLTDLTGKKVSAASSSNDSVTLVNSDLQAGIYIMSVKTADGRRHTQKAIIR